jgi:Mn-dependent DtxR family transcriptional regulator
MNINLSEEELKTIVEILTYSLGSCPVESISDKVNISADSVQELVAKLEKVSGQR